MPMSQPMYSVTPWPNVVNVLNQSQTTGNPSIFNVKNLNVTGLASTTFDVNDLVVQRHLYTASVRAAPTIAVGAGAGSGASVSLHPYSTDMAQQIALTTGSSASVNATLCTVTYGTQYAVIAGDEPYPFIMESGTADALQLATTASSHISYAIQAAASVAPNTTYTINVFVSCK